MGTCPLPNRFASEFLPQPGRRALQRCTRGLVGQRRLLGRPLAVPWAWCSFFWGAFDGGGSFIIMSFCGSCFGVKLESCDASDCD